MTQPPSYPPPPPSDPSGYQQQGYPQQGYQQPGYQQPGYPPPNFPPPPGQEWQQQQPTPKAGTNGFAIASLVLSFCGGVLLSVIFGIVALVQIRKRPQAGKGLAIAGLVISGLWVVGLIVAAAIAVANADDDSDPQSQSTRPAASANPSGGTGGDPTKPAEEEDQDVFDLKVGDCLNGLREDTELETMPVVPCNQPHEGEVFATFNLTGTERPLQSAIDEQATEGCQDRLAGYSKAAADDPKMDIFFLYPTVESWAHGDRQITCIATNGSGPLSAQG